MDFFLTIFFNHKVFYMICRQVLFVCFFLYFGVNAKIDVLKNFNSKAGSDLDSLASLLKTMPPVKVAVGVDSESMREIGSGIADSFKEGGTGRKVVAAVAEGVVTAGTKGFADAFASNASEARRGGRELAHYQGQALQGYDNEFTRTGAPHLSNIRKQYLDALGFNYSSALYYSGQIALGILLTASATYAARVLWGWIEKYIYKPRVIISKKVGSLDRLREKLYPKKMKKMVYDPIVEKQLKGVVERTKRTYKQIKGGGRKRLAFGARGIKYTNILLEGAPGTGKTMFARRLAQESGMDFVEVTGSSFFQATVAESIKVIDELFGWANKYRRLVIFIDEADGLFQDRTKLKGDSDQYKIICHLLNYLGDRSDRFMLILATNHVSAFDSAMERRIDELITMPLPDQKMRYKVLELYINELLLDRHASVRYIQAVKNCFSQEKIQEIAQQTEGLSNGDLEGIINTIKTDAYACKDGIVTITLIDTVVAQSIQKHKKFRVARVK